MGSFVGSIVGILLCGGIGGVGGFALASVLGIAGVPGAIAAAVAAMLLAVVLWAGGTAAVQALRRVR